MFRLAPEMGVALSPPFPCSRPRIWVGRASRDWAAEGVGCDLHFAGSFFLRNEGKGEKDFERKGRFGEGEVSNLF